VGDCVLSTWVVALSACRAASDGATSVAFECVPYCAQFHSVQVNGLTQCGLIEPPDSGGADPGAALDTDAGNLVMCCPVLASEFPCGTFCEGPFQ
jgi:hypothetical protein